MATQTSVNATTLVADQDTAIKRRPFWAWTTNDDRALDFFQIHCINDEQKNKKNPLNWTCNVLSWQLLPGALQSAQISVEARNFTLDVMTFYIRNQDLRLKFRFTLLNWHFVGDVHCKIFDSVRNAPVVSWWFGQQGCCTSCALSLLTIIPCELTGRSVAGNVPSTHAHRRKSFCSRKKARFTNTKKTKIDGLAVRTMKQNDVRKKYQDDNILTNS